MTYASLLSELVVCPSLHRVRYPAPFRAAADLQAQEPEVRHRPRSPLGVDLDHHDCRAGHSLPIGTTPMGLPLT